MRPFAAPRTLPLDRQFQEDVEYYLSLTPRQLPSRYLYDELGSALFEAICRLPWYGITRAEEGLLQRHGQEILEIVDSPSTLVELGPGSGQKLALLLRAAPRHRHLTVHLVDVSRAALNAARQTLRARENVTIRTHQASYEAALERAAFHEGSPGRKLALFLGSNIGNFDPPGADAFLRNIRAALAHGDALLVGWDLVKPESDLRLAYDDPLGVTAAFNRNLLVRINRELGGDFAVEAFQHRAVWNARASRVEMHLVSTRAQRVRVTASRLDITFAEGETIWTESSYKYVPSDIDKMIERAGFTPLGQWIDPDSAFALTLASAA